jgi:RNA polymerase sigma-70 factor (ECF subfamily)
LGIGPRPFPRSLLTATPKTLTDLDCFPSKNRFGLAIMFPLAQEQPGANSPPQWFNTTHWSAVLKAGKVSSPETDAAFEELCNTYWYPLYAFVRSEGSSPSDAMDLVQDFFAKLIEKREEKLRNVDAANGKFRSFLLTCIKNFSRDANARIKAAKRGGKATTVSIDEQSAEERYLNEPIDTSSPDRLYDRRWASTLLAQARQVLRNEMIAAGHGARYQAIEELLQQKTGDQTYAQLAVHLGLTESTIRCAVQKLRKRFGELIRNEIAKTLPNPTREAVDRELAELLKILGE